MGCGASIETHTHTGLLRNHDVYPEYELSGPVQEEKSPKTTESPQRADTPHLPYPKPPTRNKAAIFNLSDYAELDRQAARTPADLMYRTYEELTDHIVQGCHSDLARVRTLFTWMTSVDIGSLQRRLEQLPDPDTPLDYLLKIHWRMGNHAHFFSFLCQAAGIPCVVLTGINKSAAYQLGTRIDANAMAAQWNAILIDGEWRLVDVFWASTCIVGRRSKEWALFGVEDLDEEDDEVDELADGEMKHQVNEFFFLTDPDMLVSTHLPDDPRWQLLELPLTVQQFEDAVYRRDRFFELDIQLTEKSHDCCTIKASEGEVDISFALPESRVRDYQFRYLLYRQKSMDNITTYPLERYVFYQKTNSTLQYLIQLPLIGKFKMDIFGQDVEQNESFDLLCSYLIDCMKAKEDCLPLPDNPDIGWGPGVELERAGLVATSHKEGIITTKDGNIEIRFDKKNPVDLAHTLKHNQLDEWILKRQAILRQTDDEVIIQIRLSEAGNFAFSLFAEEDNADGTLANICNYLICNQNEETEKPPEAFPKLHNAILGASYLADQLKVVAVSHPTGDITTDDPQLLLSFDHEKNTELLCQLHSNTFEVQALTDAISHQQQDAQQDAQGDAQTTFQLDLPGPGEYGLNVYAKPKKLTTSPRIYHVHTYLINGREVREQATQTAASPEVDMVYIATSRDTAKIKKKGVFYNPLVAEVSRKNAQDAPDDEQLRSVKKMDTREDFELRLPHVGDYHMSLYEKMPNQALVDVSSYRLLRHEHVPGETDSEDDSNDELDPEEEERRRIARALEAKYRLLRQQLKAAIVTQDPVLLEQAVREFETNEVPDTFGELEKAQRLLLYIKTTDELTVAMSKRHLRRLEQAVRAAEEVGLGGRLGLQMQMAWRIVEQLRRIEQLRHDILALDQKTIAEIKSYAQPPEAVYLVMRAAFVLLGDSDDNLLDWKSVQNQIGKTGKQGVKRRVEAFDVSQSDMATVQQTRRLLGTLDLDDVRDVSVGAAAFYVWVSGNIEEAENRFTQNGGNLKKLRKKKKFHRDKTMLSHDRSMMGRDRSGVGFR